MKHAYTINVAGDYIASQHIDTQILHADYVNNASTIHTERTHVAEDVPYEEVQQGFPYITDICVQKNMQEHVENHLRTACLGSAEALWKCIHEYEFMGYLSTAHLSAATIFAAISAYFGPLPYDERNFRKYR